MSAEDMTPDNFTDLLACCDEALAAGGGLATAPPELRSRLERGIACLHLLRAVLPQPGEATTGARPPDAEDSPPWPARVGRFLIRRELGHGSFGRVFLAYDPHLRREVALKVPRPGVLLSPELTQRFHREAQAAGGLDHPHIVAVYEAGEADGVCYIASAYCPGPALAAWLKQRVDPVPYRLAAGLVAALAEAVEHAHRRGVLHRDLKPANVILDSGEGGGGRPAAPESEMGFIPRVTDFGLAKLQELGAGDSRSPAGCQTESGAILGTPSYMAPEQASGQGHAVGPAADIYALGAILYELLTGRPPFQGESLLDTLEQVRSQEPLPPSRLRPKLPRDLETVCLKCLRKERERRYGSAAELADDLRRFLRGEPIKARPVGRLERAWRWCRRNPTVAFLSTVSAFTALTLVGVLAISAAIVYGKNRDLEWSNNNLEQANITKEGAIKDLKETNIDLENQRKRTDEEHKQVEATLARSLLRPLGHYIYGDRATMDLEVEAVWELAESPSDRLRLLFIESALERPVTARQLRNRRQLAVHAAVGLDRGRRQRVEEMLLARLRDQEADPRIRPDAALVGASLGDQSPVFIRESARVVVASVGRTTDYNGLPFQSRMQALAALAPRLEPEDAAVVARSVVEAMGTTSITFKPEEQGWSEAISPLAARLEPGEVAVVARFVVEVMGRKTTTPDRRAYLAQTLAVLAGRLEPGEASRQSAAAARLVVADMGQPNNSAYLGHLRQALSVLAGWLERGEALAVARSVVEAMGNTANNPNTTHYLQYQAQALSALAGRLEPGEASRQAAAAARLIAAASKTGDPYSLGQALLPLLHWLEPGEASRQSAAAFPGIMAAIGKTTDPKGLEPWAPILKALAARLKPEEAAAVAHSLVEAMGKPNYASALNLLVQTLSVLADRLEPGEAAAVAHSLVEAMGKPNYTSALYLLAQTLSVLAGRLEREEARPLARSVLDMVGKPSYPYAVVPLAQALSALTSSLEPGEASRLAAAAARLIEATGKTNDPQAPLILGPGLSALAAHLEREEALTAARAVVEVMGKPNSAGYPPNLAQDLSALAGRLEREEALTAARAVVEVMGKKTTQSYALFTLAQALSPLVARLEQVEASRQAAAGARLVAAAMSTQANDLYNPPLALSALARWLEREDASVAAHSVLEAMGKTVNAPNTEFLLHYLTQALSALVARLEPPEASKLTSAAAKRVVAVMRQTNDPITLLWLAKALVPLASQLEPEDAAFVARSLVEAIGKSSIWVERSDKDYSLLNNATSRSLAQILSALAVGGPLEPREAAGRAVVAARAIGEELSPPTRLSGLATLLQASQRPCRFSMQELVDLLKMPTCVGPARDEVLRLLGQKCDRRFADVWEFVDYAHQYQPDLDLTTPPKRPKDAVAHLKLALELSKQGKLDEAIAEYQKALAIDPKSDIAYNNLGHILLHRGKLDEAIAEFRKAIAVEPQNSLAHTGLGLALVRQKKVDEGIAEYRKAIASDPNNAWAHYQLGLVLVDQHKWDEAIAEFDKTIAHGPKDADVSHHLGWAHVSLGLDLVKQGKVDEGIAHYHKALDINPNFAEAHVNLGLALSAQGKQDEGIAEYHKALDINPKLFQAHANLGIALFKQGKVDEAIAEFRKAIDSDEKDARGHGYLANALMARNQLDEAVAEYRKAIDLAPKDAAAHYSLANALRDKGRLDEAVAEYRKTIDLKPEFAEAHCNMGGVLRRQAKFAESLASYRRGDELGSKQPGWSYPSAEWVRQAERVVSMADKLPAFLKGEYQPQDNDERLGLAGLCVGRQLYRDAAGLYADAFDVDPKLADDLKAGRRFSAACYAALADNGQGEEKLEDKERARWRKQALDWLRADLAAHGKRLESGKPEDRTDVRQKLQHWRQELDLIGLRDKDAVQKLPAAEQEACKKLWADVDALLRKTLEKTK
jgi:serine/threonine protein kinase/tetratricopeptide (TPR) repeat protein